MSFVLVEGEKIDSSPEDKRLMEKTFSFIKHIVMAKKSYYLCLNTFGEGYPMQLEKYVEPSVTVNQVENKKGQHVITSTSERAEETTVTTVVTKPSSSRRRVRKPKKLQIKPKQSCDCSRCVSTHANEEAQSHSPELCSGEMGQSLRFGAEEERRLAP